MLARLTVAGLLLLSVVAWSHTGLATLPVQEEYQGGDVPYVPTPPEVVEQMLKLADVKKTDHVFDLGCGDGRIVVMAAEKFGARGTGIDIDPQRISEAKQNADNAHVTARVRFIQQNLFDADVHEATVVTLYLLPSVNLKLKPILLKQLKPGSRIVSHSFDMGDWKADKEVDFNGRKLYLWIVKAGMAGHQ